MCFMVRYYVLWVMDSNFEITDETESITKKIWVKNFAISRQIDRCFSPNYREICLDLRNWQHFIHKNI